MVAWVVVTSVDCQIHSPCYRSVTVLEVALILPDPLWVDIHAPNCRAPLPSPMEITPEPTGSRKCANIPVLSNATLSRVFNTPFRLLPAFDS
jgi:hypothetical protein